MYEWHRQIQTVVDEIDACIRQRDGDFLTLGSLAKRMGYSQYHATRKFKELSGITFREYLRRRRLAFALIDVRDSGRGFLDIALDYGFSSQEAFSRSFRELYGFAPGEYRRAPVPVVLRTRLNTFDRYNFGMGEIGMVKSTDEIKVYFVSIPAHTFLHIKNYESGGYWDFWEKQEALGQDCDALCGLLDSVKGKLDGDDGVTGQFSGQIMARLFEADGRSPEAYGVRLPAGFSGPVPEELLLVDVPEAEYIVFEHGAFDYEQECESASERLAQAIVEFSFDGTDYRLDETAGRVSYFYFDPERFIKRVWPVVKK